MRGKECGQTLRRTSVRKEKVQKVSMKEEGSQLPRFIVLVHSWTCMHLTEDEGWSGGGGQTQMPVGPHTCH